MWRSERDLNPCSGICSPEPRLSAIRPSFTPAIKSTFYLNYWSGRPGSNRRPEPWQGSALPTALRPHIAKAKSSVSETTWHIRQ